MKTKLEDIKKQAGIVGQSKVINEALDEAARIAATNSHVLILGEPGTEKKEFANFIHLLSKTNSPARLTINTSPRQTCSP